MPLRRSDTRGETAADGARPQVAAAADALLVRLADGRPRAPDALIGPGRANREELDLVLRELERRGVELVRDDDGRIRLARPLDLLDADALLTRIPPAAAGRIERLEIFLSLDSTNRRLLDQGSRYVAPQGGADRLVRTGRHQGTPGSA